MKRKIWKEVVGYEGKYRVSSDGEVFSLLRNKILKTRKWGNSEYKIVGLYKDGKRKQITVHRLVALNFLGKPSIISSERIEINHKNGIKTDNRIENLEWCTHGRNQSHAYNTGLRPNFDGENNPRAKFNNNFVKQVREEYKNGSKRRELKRKYNLTYSQVNRIIYNLNWKNI